MADNAPGKHFREGMSYVELTRRFPDDAAAEAWFTETRWPNGVHCPKCGSDNIQERPTRKPQPYRCRNCRKDFSVRTDTLMHSSPLGFQVWAIAIFLNSTNLKGVSSMKLHRDLGVTQKTAWHLAHRIRETWADNAEMFTGPVEADETYVGGKRKNMPKSKRKTLKGRGAAGKTAIAGVKDRATNRVQAKVVEDTTAETLQGFVTSRTQAGAQVYTDDHGAYRGIARPHAAVRHSAGEYVRGDVHTNGIEALWAMIKRAEKGTFHKLSPKHMDRYVGEFAGRHNIRSRDTLDMMRSIVFGMDGKRLRYKDLIASNGLPSGARPVQ